MSAELRIFIAIPIPVTPAIEAVREELREYGSALRVSRDETLHLTIKFLGPTPSDRVPEIETVLHETLADQSTFELQLNGVGTFPKPSRPSVVWIGVQDNPPLNSIATRLEENLASIGFPKEERPFRPHITIARVRRGRRLDLSNVCETNQNTNFGHQAATPFILYESGYQDGPKSGGPTYNELIKVPLA